MLYIVIGTICCILAVIGGTIVALFDKPKKGRIVTFVTKGLPDSEDEKELSKALENLEVCNGVEEEQWTNWP